MAKFKNRYRIESIRLQNWDYRWAASYFVTICTQNREHFFGEILNGKMQLSRVGVIADILWHQIPYHSKNVELGAFVVMPDHIHGIIIINRNENENVVTGMTEETGHALSLRSSPPSSPPSSPNVSSPKPIIEPKTIGQQRFQNIGKNSLSSIIGSYKSAVSKHARQMDSNFGWQTRFYDKIIRDDASFQNISNYIIANPSNWKGGKFFNEDPDNER